MCYVKQADIAGNLEILLASIHSTAHHQVTAQNACTLVAKELRISPFLFFQP
jgi:hypothetical protein